MAGKSLIWMGLALLVGVVALAWPSLEELLISQGVGCPWPIKYLHSMSSPFTAPTSPASEASEAAEAGALRSYTLAELRQYDGSNEALPLLLAVGGHVLDVSEGAKFYGVGRAYHQFAGTACTRALTLGSLDTKDISDDRTGLSDKELKEWGETVQFYLEKYPVVGKLATTD